MFNYITVFVLIVVASIIAIGSCTLVKSIEEVETIEEKLEKIERDIESLNKVIEDENQELFKRIVIENEVDKILND